MCLSYEAKEIHYSSASFCHFLSVLYAHLIVEEMHSVVVQF